jgi:Cu/Ag efflux pump CusA
VLARAVLGGVAVGTMTTLFFVPFLYSIIGRFERLEAKVAEIPAHHGSPK